MKRRLQGIFRILVIGMSMLFATQTVNAAMSKQERAAKIKLARAAYGTSMMAETITKAYLYAGNKVGVRQATQELQVSLKTFQEKFNILDESIGDPKSKNLLLFMKMSFDELRDITKQPYSLDNAQIALDLSATITEGAIFVANDIKKSMNYKDKNTLNGARVHLESIAKYYMAYQAGIKDDNTIKLMKETVDIASNTIDSFAKDPRNTVAMNQRMNKVQRLWGVVYKFYLDIDKGGLPFIVYKTTRDLNKNIRLYSKDMSKVIKGKVSK